MGFRGEAALERFVETDELPELELINEVCDPRREEEIRQLILDHRENGRKLARSILRRWRVRMPAEEIDSIVDLSLCEAARRYSSERGASFMTFFFYHLRGHLVRSVARAAQNSNAMHAFTKSTGGEGNEWSHLGADNVWTIVPDFVGTSKSDAETPEHAMLRREKIKQCQSACAQLDLLEREIIDRSFSSEQPLVDIAKSLGYSRCHISRVKKSALERLKGMLHGAEAEAAAKAIKVEEAPVVTARSSVGDRMHGSRRSRRRSVSRGRMPKRHSENRAA